MGIIKYNITFPNGVTKSFDVTESRDYTCRCIVEDKNNLCPRCNKLPVFTKCNLLKKIGRYNYWIDYVGNDYIINVNEEGLICGTCRSALGAQRHMNELWKDEEFIKHHAEIHREMMINNNNDYEYRAHTSCRAAYYELAGFDIIEFYYAEVDRDDVYKIGISSNTEGRKNNGPRNYKYINKYILRKGDVKFIADLEYNVKVNFCIRDYDLGDEFIPKQKLNEMIDYVINYN